MQVKVLEGTQGAWLLEMLEAFNNGDLHKYDELCATHASTLNNLPQMVEHERDLREKITILALTELIFRYLFASIQVTIYQTKQRNTWKEEQE